MKKFMLLIFIAGFGLYLFCQEKPKTDIDQWLNQTEENHRMQCVIPLLLTI
jgi:hypothetical protein